VSYFEPDRAGVPFRTPAICIQTYRARYVDPVRLVEGSSSTRLLVLGFGDPVDVNMAGSDSARLTSFVEDAARKRALSGP
jgi:hypothetical protein